MIFQSLMVIFSPQIQQLHDMEEVCYEKVLEQIRAGHQVMLKFMASSFCHWAECLICILRLKCGVKDTKEL